MMEETEVKEDEMTSNEPPESAQDVQVSETEISEAEATKNEDKIEENSNEPDSADSTSSFSKPPEDLDPLTRKTTLAKLTALSNAWKVFGLVSLQAKLDDIAGDIAARQDESEAAKKGLIEMMRQFKRTQSEEVRISAAPLVKSFQNEVDNLSRRSKAAEKAFFEVYKALADVPDPGPAFEVALECQRLNARVQELEVENKTLNDSLDEAIQLKPEMKKKDKEIAKLQSKVEAYDRNIDATLNQRIKDASERMVTEYNEALEKVQNEKSIVEKRAEDLEVKLRRSEKQMSDLTEEFEAAQFKKDEGRSANDAETEILTNDLESALQRASDAEREVEVLKERLERAAAEANDPDSNKNGGSSYEMESMRAQLALKEREMTALVSETNALKKGFESDMGKLQERTSSLETTTKALTSENEELNISLDSKRDYDQIKRDLNILKSIEFQENSQDQENGGEKPMEALIMKKAKAMQNENTGLRFDKEQLVAEISRLKEDIAEKAAQSERKDKLISELEDHVDRLQDLSTPNRGEAEGRSSADILVDALTSKSTGEDDESSYEYGSPSVLRSSSTALTEKSSPSPSTPGMNREANNSAALVPILQAQKERFRAKNEELENLLSSRNEQLTLLQSQVKDLQEDNLKMYEKIRFLRGFEGKSASPSSTNRDRSSAVVQMSSDSESESRYRKTYEQKLDPFNSFSRSERQNRIKNLNFVEKFVYQFLQIAMASKPARLFIFFYAVTLHVLVFAVLQYQAYYETQKATEWEDRFHQHMEDEHGGFKG